MVESTKTNVLSREMSHVHSENSVMGSMYLLLNFNSFTNVSFSLHPSLLLPFYFGKSILKQILKHHTLASVNSSLCVSN